ncbi:MAG: bifunctional metallophosphatase/5'-nucleotidase, partial [Novosphingobium sp.]|nr:bifunctional metallophosphatase/5'-nucleotidase [Novosphingobium sp.]
MIAKALTRSAPLAALSLLAACATPQAPHRASAPPGHAVNVGIIAINDFHGALEPPKAAVAAPDGKGGTVPVPAG